MYIFFEVIKKIIFGLNCNYYNQYNDVVYNGEIIRYSPYTYYLIIII